MEKSAAKLHKMVYLYTWHKDSMKKANIMFGFDEQLEKRFVQCQYLGVSEAYTIDDWDFLHDLSAEILKLENMGYTTVNLKY